MMAITTLNLRSLGLGQILHYTPDMVIKVPQEYVVNFFDSSFLSPCVLVAYS